MNQLRLPAALLAISAFSPAWASEPPEPPPSPDDRQREANASAVEKALAPCAAEATKNGTFELVQIGFGYSTGKPFAPTLVSRRPSLGRPLYWCVVGALRDLRLAPLSSEWSFDQKRFYGLGKVPALPKELLPAWQRAGSDPTRVQRELGRWLQPEVEITSSGCLRFAGPALLGQPLDEWLDGIGVSPIWGGDNDRLYPLPGDWWLRHTNWDGDAEDIVDHQVCLEKVDSAVSALRRNDSVRSFGADFDAEWVVDAEGKLAGEIGLCFTTQARGSFRAPYTASEALVLRREIEDRLRGIDYGRGAGMRRIVIRYGRGALLQSAFGAQRPLDRSASAIESRCDRRRVLRCDRDGVAGRASLESQSKLRLCLRDTGLDAARIFANFDLSPDGKVENLRVAPTYWNLPGPAPRCVRDTVAALAFPRSEGGSCGIGTPVHLLLGP